MAAAAETSEIGRRRAIAEEADALRAVLPKHCITSINPDGVFAVSMAATVYRKLSARFIFPPSFGGSATASASSSAPTDAEASAQRTDQRPVVEVTSDTLPNAVVRKLSSVASSKVSVVRHRRRVVTV